MKKNIRAILILVLMVAIFVVPTLTFATTTYRPSDVQIDTSDTGTVENVGSKILGVIRVVGTIVAVAMLIVLGIKYMMGSAEEKAEYKKTLFPYFIGAILIFAATNLADMIYGWASTIK